MRVVKEGWPFVLCPFAAALALFCGFLSAPGFLAAGLCLAGGVLLLVFSFFCVFFFRDPPVSVTLGENLILSPCNGTVLEVVEAENEKIIRVFLSIFNVHLQRAPVDGRVTSVEHRDGKFLMAWDPRAHSLNEQNVFTIESESGVYIVRQIAGFLARRCVSWVKTGDELKKGDKIGMIKFSSQVDLHLPKTAVVSVKKGDRLRAGISEVGVAR